jgi:hypothetical protein
MVILTSFPALKEYWGNPCNIFKEKWKEETSSKKNLRF